MKILILGGTVFTGKEMARLFTAAGHEVATFTRSESKAKNHFTGDRRSPQDLKKAASAAHWDIVIDNLAYTADDIQLALQHFPSIRRYLVHSTVSVYRYAKKPAPFTEDSVDHHHTPDKEDLENVHWSYARGKMEAERALLGEKKIPWTAFRSPVIYGPNDPSGRGFWYLVRILDGNPILLADNGEHRFKLAYSEDVAKAFLQAATEKNTEGKFYNVGQTEIITLKQFLEESAKCLGKKLNTVSFPYEKLGEELGGPYSNMNNFYADVSLAGKELGLTPTPFEKFIRTTTEWFLKNPSAAKPSLSHTRIEEARFLRDNHPLLGKIN